MMNQGMLVWAGLRWFFNKTGRVVCLPRFSANPHTNNPQRLCLTRSTEGQGRAVLDSYLHFSDKNESRSYSISLLKTTARSDQALLWTRHCARFFEDWKYG